MGLSASKPHHARRRDAQDFRDAPRHAQHRKRWFASSLTALYLLLNASVLAAETLRVASFHTELTRRGPGLLLRDILTGEDAQIEAVIGVLQATNADILALQGIDYDLENMALSALSKALKEVGLDYPHFFSARPNSGRMTALDLDGDGRLGGPGDAQGYGRFFGKGSMAILSRYPIDQPNVQDFTALLWRDLPGALLPETADGPFPSAAALAIQRLASKGAWVVPILHPAFGTVTLLTFDAGPPVFDGPEDRNGKRNHDEIMFWDHYLQGTFGAAPTGQFVMLGNANLDPERGEGRRVAIQHLLTHPKLQDPLPQTPTVFWKNVGTLRVGYVLPSRDWTVVDAQVTPPNPIASRHQLIWVDLTH